MEWVVCFVSEEKFGRESRVIPMDFSGGLDIYTMISDQLRDLDVGVLSEYAEKEGGYETHHFLYYSVNNVGYGYVYPDVLHKLPAEVSLHVEYSALTIPYV